MKAKRVAQKLRLQFGIARFLVRLGIRTVSAHAIVQARAAGTKPSAFASYSPRISPMNSFMKLRWNHGGRNVCSATIQRGGKIDEVALAVPGISDGEVSTV